MSLNKDEGSTKSLPYLTHFNHFDFHFFHTKPIPEEFQNGEGFGYVVAFRPAGTSTWMQTVVASAEATRYVFKNESIPPLSLFEVRVGVYNIIGEGPFSQVTTVYSAEEGRCMNVFLTHLNHT